MSASTLCYKLRRRNCSGGVKCELAHDRRRDAAGPPTPAEVAFLDIVTDFMVKEALRNASRRRKETLSRPRAGEGDCRDRMGEQRGTS